MSSEKFGPMEGPVADSINVAKAFHYWYDEKLSQEFRQIGDIVKTLIAQDEPDDQLFMQLRQNALDAAQRLQSHYTHPTDESSISAKQVMGWLREVVMLCSLGSPAIFEQSDDLFPEQQPAPFQYGFENDLLVVREQVLGVDGSYAPTTDAARDTLIEQSAMILQILDGSNHPHVTLLFKAAHGKLQAAKNIIQLGIVNQTCRDVTTAAKDEGELAATLAALLISHVNAVFAYIEQFPEWLIYDQKAAETRMHSNDFAHLIDTVGALADAFEKIPSSVSPAVPQSLVEVRNWARTQLRAPSGRVVRAVVETLANLISALMAGPVASVVKTHLGDIKAEGRKMLAKATIGAVLGVSGYSYLYLISHAPELSWISSSLEFLKSIANFF